MIFQRQYLPKPHIDLMSKVNIHIDRSNSIRMRNQDISEHGKIQIHVGLDGLLHRTMSFTVTVANSQTFTCLFSWTPFFTP